MTIILSLIPAFLCSPFASALALNLISPNNSSQQQALDTAAAARFAGSLQSADAAAAAAAGLTFHADCDGAETGVDLNKNMCNDLVTFGIPDVASRGVIRYGDRSIGLYDVNLPQRYISGNGRCVVDVTLQDIHKTTRYYPFGLALAATYLSTLCVQAQTPPQGGTLVQFDTNKNMKLVLQSYQPRAVCLGPTASPDIRDSCQQILDTMPVSGAAVIFGSTRAAIVRTPYGRTSADGLCRMEISTAGVASDVATWRDFWEIGVAINGMCIRYGRQGFQINIGSLGNLHMELKDTRNLRGTVSVS